MQFRSILVFPFFALLLRLPLATAGEVQSPELFLRESYGWTIAKLDDERGLFGSYKNFNCYDDRLQAPRNADESASRRIGVSCNTKRYSNENLGAMIFVTWANPAHKNPVRTQEVLEKAANQMAGNEKERNAEPKCELQKTDTGGKQLEIYDCSMVLPFGTYFASVLHFEHRGLDFYIRVQNASNIPYPSEPKKAVRAIAEALIFDR